jgi:phospholipid transport system transporter-binding protein
MLTLPAELTQIQATACLKALLLDLKTVSGKAVVLDASALTRFDSAALAVLLELRRKALALDKSFVVQGLPPRLGSLASLYGIEELIPPAAAALTAA